MKAIGDRIVIERVVTQKKRAIEIVGEAGFDSKVTDKIIQIGAGVPESFEPKVGDFVVVNVHARPEGMELRSDEKDKMNRTFHGIIHFEEVAGIYDPEDKMTTKKSGAIMNKPSEN